ncbi:putative WD-repeat protein SPA1/2/3/4 [Helianthus annuus]|nr:putative WD-repeat protein SPA1/2/3/4 [Helianthus annuus]
MSSFNRVSFIESVSYSDSGPDESNNQTDEFVGLCSQNPLWVQSGFENNQQVLQMESDWYTSPEEAVGVASSCASDVYRLGVLLFEPCFACGLWLLHPEPASRPKIDEVLKSEFLNEPRDDLVEREAFIEP